jgi:hypothetical protein
MARMMWRGWGTSFRATEPGRGWGVHRTRSGSGKPLS